MNLRIKKGFNLLFSLALFIIIIPCSLAVGLGISPSSVYFENVQKGGYAESSVFLSTTSIDNIYVDYETSGEINKWLNITDEIVLNSVSEKEVKIKIIPPEDTKNGIYEGRVLFMAYPSKGIGYISTGLITTVTLKLRVNVTGEEIIKCNVGAIEIEPLEENYPLVFHAVVKNKGNVRIKPEFSLDVWDDDNRMVFFREFSSDEDILPTTTKKISYEIDGHYLAQGDYIGEIIVEMCGISREINFRVEEKGAIMDEGELVSVEVENNNVNENEIVPVKAVFKNTGKRTVTVRFKAEVYNNGKIIEVIESDSYYAYPGETTEIETFYHANNIGNYEIKGRVIYNEKESYEQSTNIEVIKKESEYISKIKYIVFGLLVLVIAVMVGMILRKKKKK